MMEEMGSLGSPDNCYALYCTCVEEPHKFMYIDNKFNVHRCFSEHIWSKYTEDGHYNTDFVGSDTKAGGMMGQIDDPTKKNKNIDK